MDTPVCHPWTGRDVWRIRWYTTEWSCLWPLLLFCIMTWLLPAIWGMLAAMAANVRVEQRPDGYRCYRRIKTLQEKRPSVFYKKKKRERAREKRGTMGGGWLSYRLRFSARMVTDGRSEGEEGVRSCLYRYMGCVDRRGSGRELSRRIQERWGDLSLATPWLARRELSLKVQDCNGRKRVVLLVGEWARG